jgi:S-DNA-T family DNA segregation ATPase FtsK/SpoIIIE
MGAALFTLRAYDPDAALRTLKALLRVIDERGHRMAGHTRLHAPTPGDPLHVLVIDELAALTAYADVMVRREAERLLSEILTQGRALGVVVVACVQDPRKDVVPVRGLFTQTIALRLRSTEETVMVLGEGASAIAPAHLISPRVPGTAWIVDDTGAVDRVRADFWPDDVIRAVARSHVAAVVTDLPAESCEEKAREFDRALDEPRRPRSPRRPRAANGRMQLLEATEGDDS